MSTSQREFVYSTREAEALLRQEGEGSSIKSWSEGVTIATDRAQQTHFTMEGAIQSQRSHQQDGL